MSEQMLPAHPVADLFPLMSDAEYQPFKADIAANGQREPIWVYKGLILDGRNRWRACSELGILPDVREYGGDEAGLTAFVISLNLHRRHLSESQRAVIGARLANAGEGGDHRSDHWTNCSSGQVTQAVAAKMLNISTMSIKRAKSIEREAPELLPRIAAGELNLREAQQKVDSRKRDAMRASAIEYVCVSPHPNIYLGDFREQVANIADASVSLIFTDPPYDEAHVPLYGELARVASRVLVPGGSLIAYAGHYALPRILADMSEHLRYWWMISLEHSGASARLPGLWVFVGWKPLVWFVKGGRNSNGYVDDSFRSSEPDKRHHEWEQDVSEASYYIEHLTNPGDLVCDPFLGGGTTLVAATRAGRRFCGCDSDPNAVATAIRRIECDQSELRAA
jgi:16S rRNA G966 N2-methylase RsmD